MHGSSKEKRIQGASILFLLMAARYLPDGVPAIRNLIDGNFFGDNIWTLTAFVITILFALSLNRKSITISKVFALLLGIVHLWSIPKVFQVLFEYFDIEMVLTTVVALSVPLCYIFIFMFLNSSPERKQKFVKMVAMFAAIGLFAAVFRRLISFFTYNTIYTRSLIIEVASFIIFYLYSYESNPHNFFSRKHKGVNSMGETWIQRTTKSWFGNPGEKIKKVAVFLFWLTTFLCAATFVLFIILEIIDSWNANGWYILLSVLAIFVQYFNCLILYGFGQLIESVSNQRSAQPEATPIAVATYDDLPVL